MGSAEAAHPTKETVRSRAEAQSPVGAGTGRAHSQADGDGWPSPPSTVDGEVFPTPDQAIDEPVTEWFELAKDAFFECPPTSTPNPGMDYAYGQLSRLQAEVAAVVAIEAAVGLRRMPVTSVVEHSQPSSLVQRLRSVRCPEASIELPEEPEHLSLRVADLLGEVAQLRKRRLRLQVLVPTSQHLRPRG